MTLLLERRAGSVKCLVCGSVTWATGRVWVGGVPAAVRKPLAGGKMLVGAIPR